MGTPLGGKPSYRTANVDGTGPSFNDWAVAIREWPSVTALDFGNEREMGSTLCRLIPPEHRRRLPIMAVEIQLGLLEALGGVAVLAAKQARLVRADVPP